MKAAPWLPLLVPKPVTPAGKHASSQQSARAFLTVLRYPSNGGADVWAAIIASYARYHRMLGFAGSVLYMRDNLLAQFVRQTAAQQAIREGLLFVVRWGDIAPFPDDELQVYDQVRPHFLCAPVCTSHTLLTPGCRAAHHLTTRVFGALGRENDAVPCGC